MYDTCISTLAALAGTAAGGLASPATNRLTRASQARAQRLAGERARRDELHGRFIDEAAQLSAAEVR